MKDAKAPTSAVVGMEQIQIVSANPRRTGLFIRNLSSHTVALSFDGTAEIGKGINLNKDESFSMGQFDFSTSDIHAIADAEGCNVAIQEFETTED